MIREIWQELVLGPDPTLAAQYSRTRFGHFFLDNLFASVCIGVSWGMFIKILRTERKYLGSEDPKYLYFRNRNLAFNDSLHALLSDTGTDLNHISKDFLRYGFLPYAYIDRDDYRLGESEWTYREIEAPSVMVSSGHIDDVVGEGKDSVEFSYFKKTISMLGQYPLSHVTAMFNQCKVLELEENEVLFEVGDPDDFMFLVIRGSIQVIAMDDAKHMNTLRIASRGDRVYSLFSFTDVLTGHSKPMKTVEAFATTKSRVLKFPVPVFKEYLNIHEERIPDVIYRLIRRIYDMNFVMLHKILGLDLAMMSTSVPNPITLQKENCVRNDPYQIPDPSPTQEIPDQIRQDAIKSFMNYLGILEDTDVLDDCLVLIFDPDDVPNEEVLSRHPILDNENIKFKYVFKGQVELYRLNAGHHEADDDPDDELILYHEPLYMLFPGEGVGGLSTFAEVENFLFMRIIQRSIIVATTRVINIRLFQKFPAAILPMAHQIVTRISPVLRKMDFGIEWTVAEGGKALFTTGSEVQDTFIVLGGRLRSYMIDPKGKLSYYGEYEKNDWVGLVEAMVRFPVRSKTVIAVRDTEMCKIPMDFVTFLKLTFPQAAFSLVGYIANRVGKYRFHSRSLKLSPEQQLVAGTSRRCASLALIPTSEDIPYIPFAKEIKKHHDTFGTTAILSWNTIQEEFNIVFLDFSRQYSVETWVMGVLARYDLVIFVCSDESDLWNSICIRHAEMIISLGLQGEPVAATRIEKMMITQEIAVRKRKEMVILHKIEVEQRPGRYKLPKDTIAWLEQRPWLSVHHHIRIPGEAFNFLGLVSLQTIDLHYKALNRVISKHSDMSRYCRWLIGKSIGVVFTAGGSRMATQAGVLKALAEHDVPIDMVGGVGTGFIVSAFYSIYQDFDKVLKYTEEFFSGIRAASNTTFDITIPYISPIQGRAFLALVMRYFARTRMEDTWIPIFVVTCDISKQGARVTRDGPFWIYIRTTLSNFLGAPPVCDPKDGGYIVDGSFANPIPEDVMRRFGAEYVLVINTSDGKTFEPQRFDPTKDIWTNLWRLFLQMASRLNFMTPDFVHINDMIGRTQKVMYSEAVEANTDGLFVAFIKPDSEPLPAQLYENFNRMMLVGYRYARKILDKCPVKGVPFHEFWLNVRTTSTHLEVQQGRGIRNVMNDEFWERMDERIFTRDDKLEEIKANEMKAKLKLGKQFRGELLTQEDLANLATQDKLDSFRSWVLTSDDGNECSRQRSSLIIPYFN